MNRVVAFALVLACRGDARAPERVAAPARAETVVTPPPQQPAPADASLGPPPGSDALVRVPDDVARGIALRAIAKDLERPVLLTFAPGDARRRLFVVEQRGAIRTIEAGKVVKKPFFTIGGLGTGNEQGLLGLAFHPQFATNGRLYVYFTTKNKRCHVVEYKVDARDPDRVDPASARELLDVEHPYSNHNGGNLTFGHDGKLYTGIGDGGAANDPHRNGQNPESLLAKLLRFDVDAPAPHAEIVHIGLRNPWRFWFDVKTGDLYIGDVGQNLWEEVDVVPADTRGRVNFGWNVMEGTHCFDAANGRTRADCDHDGLAPPAVEYGHDQGCSITGGVTYRGKALPELAGRYFYADYCTSLLRSFLWTRGFVREHWDWKASIDREGVLQQVSSFGTDADGEMYIVELTGTIYELVRRT